VKFERTDHFIAEFKKLTPRERSLALTMVEDINSAYAAHRATGKDGIPQWPARLRVRKVEGIAKVWEITWSFSGPDGRATFEYFDLDGEPAILWRRIGTHDIFKAP
jgi:hypothetical protein